MENQPKQRARDPVLLKGGTLGRGWPALWMRCQGHQGCARRRASSPGNTRLQQTGAGAKWLGGVWGGQWQPSSLAHRPPFQGVPTGWQPLTRMHRRTERRGKEGRAPRASGPAHGHSSLAALPLAGSGCGSASWPSDLSSSVGRAPVGHVPLRSAHGPARGFCTPRGTASCGPSPVSHPVTPLPCDPPSLPVSPPCGDAQRVSLLAALAGGEAPPGPGMSRRGQCSSGASPSPLRRVPVLKYEECSPRLHGPARLPALCSCFVTSPPQPCVPQASPALSDPSVQAFPPPPKTPPCYARRSAAPACSLSASSHRLCPSGILSSLGSQGPSFPSRPLSLSLARAILPDLLPLTFGGQGSIRISAHLLRHPPFLTPQA